MQQSNLPFDHHSMLSIVSLLAERSVHEPTCRNECDFWTPDGLFMRHLLPDSDPAEDTPRRLRAMLDVLRNAETGLASVQKQIESDVKDLQEQLEMHWKARGLDSLPDEIVMHIFEIAFDHGAAFEESIDYGTGVAEADPNSLGSTLVRVNRRFRSIALRTPLLWSIVSSGQTEETRNMNLARSKATGLRVYLLACPQPVERNETCVDSTEHITTLLSHVLRWEILRIGTEWQDDYPECWKLLYEAQRKLGLPALRSLYLNWLCGGKSDDDCADFYSSWVMPNLAFLTIEDMIPAPGLGSSLVQFEIILTNRYAEMGVQTGYFDRLITSLGTLVCLERLKMVCGGCCFDEENFVDLALKCALSSLTMLEFEMQEAARCSLQTMMRVMHTPNIQKLCVTFTERLTFTERHHGVCRFLTHSYLPARAEEYISLTELLFVHFGREHLPGSDTIHDLDALLRRLPQVERLAIKAEARNSQKKCCESPNTRVVRSEGSNASNALHALMRSSSLGNIKLLEIAGRPRFSECTAHFKCHYLPTLAEF